MPIWIRNEGREIRTIIIVGIGIAFLNLSKGVTCHCGEKSELKQLSAVFRPSVLALFSEWTMANSNSPIYLPTWIRLKGTGNRFFRDFP
jgi:hypothetical protein